MPLQSIYLVPHGGIIIPGMEPGRDDTSESKAAADRLLELMQQVGNEIRDDEIDIIFLTSPHGYIHPTDVQVIFNSILEGWQYFHGWTDNPEQTLIEAIESAQTAIQLDGQNAAAYAALGYLHRFSRNETVSVSNLERAVSLNPNDASIRLQFAHVLDWFRLQERALPQILGKRRGSTG